MVRLYLPSARLSDRELTITHEKAHYLISVLRCRTGDNFIVFDGKGNCFLAVITETRRHQVMANVLEAFSCDMESPLYCILAQGILRGEKMDMVVQKTTELGVHEIVPLTTERSQLKDTGKVKRWRRISEEAARQSGRSMVPHIHEPIDLKKFLLSLVSDPPVRGFIFYEEGGTKLSTAVKELHRGQDSGFSRMLVLIGPEGGFSREEVGLAEERDLRVVSLGKRVLRAETAAISAIALMQFSFGDMG